MPRFRISHIAVISDPLLCSFAESAVRRVSSLGFCSILISLSAVSGAPRRAAVGSGMELAGRSRYSTKTCQDLSRQQGKLGLPANSVTIG
jgi:hypothetical protein